MNNLQIREYQKQGVGRALMTEAEKRLKERGCRQMALAVDDNNKSLKKWYAKQGFEAGTHGPYRWMYKI